MKKIAAPLIAFAVLFGAAWPSNADITVGQFKAGRERSAAAWGTYFQGVIAGLSWANAGLDVEQIYCLPDRFVLTSQQALSITLRFVDASDHFDDDSYLALAVMFALQDMFPCESAEALAIRDAVDAATREAARVAGD